MTLPTVTATGRLGADPEVSQAAGPGGEVPQGGTMRVLIRDLTPWADDYQSVRVSVSAGQTGYVPQSSPSLAGSECPPSSRTRRRPAGTATKWVFLGGSLGFPRRTGFRDPVAWVLPGLGGSYCHPN